VPANSNWSRRRVELKTTSRRGSVAGVSQARIKERIEDYIADASSILRWFAVPLGMWLVGRHVDKAGRWRQARVGGAIGAIALPLSFLAYSFYWFVPVVGILIGLPGLLLLMWHLLPLVCGLPSWRST
jgi:hypothetical protein